MVEIVEEVQGIGISTQTNRLLRSCWDGFVKLGER